MDQNKHNTIEENWRMASDEVVIKAATENKDNYSSEIQKIIESEVIRRKLEKERLLTTKESAYLLAKNTVTVLIITLVGIIAFILICISGALGRQIGRELFNFFPLNLLYILTFIVIMLIFYTLLKRRKSKH